MKFTRIATAIAIGAVAMLTPVVATAADMVITSEIAGTHWKARQMDTLAADITKRTNGRINAKVFHASTLYKDKDALAALSTGAVHMVWPVSNYLENVNPAYGIISLPFSVKDSMMQNDEFRAGLTSLMSSLVGAIIGSIFLAMKGRDRNTTIPFGPYLAIAGWIVFIWGDQIIGTYLRMSGLD